MTGPEFAVTADGEVTAVGQARSSGAVAYRLRGRMTGTIVFVPDTRDDEAVAERVAVRLGDGDDMLATALRDLPVVGAVALIGGGDRIDLAEPGWLSRLRIAPRDPSASRGPQADTVTGYARRVCAGLAERHRTLDLTQLALTAARHTADRRLRRLAHRHLLPAASLLADCETELATAWTLAGQLQQLSALRLLPDTAPTCRYREVTGIYISSDLDGHWLTCPVCHRPTVMIRPGDGFGGLLAEHRRHRCTTAHR